MAGGNVFLGRGKPSGGEKERGREPKKPEPGGQKESKKEERTPDIKPVRRDPKEEPFEPGPQYRRKGVRKENDAWRNLGKSFFGGGGDP